MIGPWARKDAEAFADALEGRGRLEGEIRELVQCAESLCAAAAAEPSRDFVLNLRTELMCDAQSVLIVKEKRLHAARSTPAPVRRRLAALTTGLIVAIGGAGLVSSSANALPGEMLYPVKRGVESVELSLQRADASRGEFQLDLARERLVEARSIAANADANSPDLLANTLAAFSDQASAGSENLFADYTDGGSSASVEKVYAFAVESSGILSRLSSSIPSDATDAFEGALDTVGQLAIQASMLCSECNTNQLDSLTASVEKAIAELNSTPTASAPVKDTAADSGAPVPPNPLSIVTPTTKKLSTTSPPTEQPESVSDITDPVSGVVLGNEDQSSLIPGLLGGLSGN